MSIDTCFFPCAGLGTRMGELGKELPKPLWPLFETTLLGGQLAYAKELGFTKYCINTHHQAMRLQSWISEQNEAVENFYEENLLGSGGCFHNIARSSKEIDELYIFNPDSFLMMDRSDWSNFIERGKNANQLLIAIPCKPSDSYNRLVIEDNRLKEIVPPSLDAPEFTYSGFGKVSLSKLENVDGASGFFQTVAIPGENEVEIFHPEKPFEFWDFGTIDSYKKNVVKLLGREGGLLGDFLKRRNFLDRNSELPGTYKSSSESVINFTGEKLDTDRPGIYIRVDNKTKRID